MTLDPTIAAMCAAAWLELLALWCAAVLHGATLPDALAWLLERDQLTADATSAGYLGLASQTRSFRYAAICAGVRKPPHRALVNDDAGQKSRARVWGHAC